MGADAMHIVSKPTQILLPHMYVATITDRYEMDVA